MRTRFVSAGAHDIPTVRELGCRFHVNAEPSLTVDGLGHQEVG